MLAPRKWIVRQYLWGEEYTKRDSFRSWVFWLFVAAAILGCIAAAI